MIGAIIRNSVTYGLTAAALLSVGTAILSVVYYTGLFAVYGRQFMGFMGPQDWLQGSINWLPGSILVIGGAFIFIAITQPQLMKPTTDTYATIRWIRRGWPIIRLALLGALAASVVLFLAFYVLLPLDSQFNTLFPVVIFIWTCVGLAYGSPRLSEHYTSATFKRSTIAIGTITTLLSFVFILGFSSGLERLSEDIPGYGLSLEPGVTRPIEVLLIMSSGILYRPMDVPSVEIHFVNISAVHELETELTFDPHNPVGCRIATWLCFWSKPVVTQIPTKPALDTPH